MNPTSAPRHIYVVGAQSTGKTTLVKALERAFAKTSHPPSKIIKEVARNVLIEHNITAENIRSSTAKALQLQRLIMLAQLEAEHNTLCGGGWFIADRSGVDPVVYARKYVSEEAAKSLLDSMEWKKLKERMMDSLVIVCEAGGNWLVDDGVRLMPENREKWMEFDKMFRCCLDEWSIKYHVLPCNVEDIEERVAFVIERWRAEKDGEMEGN